MAIHDLLLDSDPRVRALDSHSNTDGYPYAHERCNLHADAKCDPGGHDHSDAHTHTDVHGDMRADWYALLQRPLHPVPHHSAKLPHGRVVRRMYSKPNL